MSHSLWLWPEEEAAFGCDGSSRTELRASFAQLQGCRGRRFLALHRQTHISTLWITCHTSSTPPQGSIPGRAANSQALAFCSSSPCRLARKYPLAFSLKLLLFTSLPSCPYQTPLNTSIPAGNKQPKPRKLLIKTQNPFNDLGCELKARQNLNATRCSTYISGYVDTHLQEENMTADCQKKGQ